MCHFFLQFSKFSWASDITAKISHDVWMDNLMIMKYLLSTHCVCVASKLHFCLISAGFKVAQRCVLQKY